LASRAPQDIFLSIVFPAFNEADRLPGTLRRTIAYLRQQDYTWEIIVVDDGSADSTAADAKTILEQEHVPGCVISLPTNQGKGVAVKQGLQAARGQILFFSDADLSTPIEELETMLPFFEQGWDIVIGSRGMKESMVEVRQAWWRKYSGKLFNVFVQLFVLRGIKDTQCGFKGFSRDVLPGLLERQKLIGFSFDVELLWLAKRLGYRIKEVPVHWCNDAASKVSFFEDGFSMCRDILTIQRMHKDLKARGK